MQLDVILIIDNDGNVIERYETYPGSYGVTNFGFQIGLPNERQIHIPSSAQIGKIEVIPGKDKDARTD